MLHEVLERDYCRKPVGGDIDGPALDRTIAYSHSVYANAITILV